MGKSNWKGIYARKTSIRVFFVLDGNEHWETLSIPPTPANMNYADSMRKEILRRIEIGTFKFEDYFPASKNVKKEDKRSLPLFHQVMEDWLESKKRNLAKATLQGYRSAMETHFLEPFGNRIMAEIDFSELDRVMVGMNVSNKSFSNYLSILRELYVYAIKASKTTGVTENQAKKIEAAKKEKTQPDPLTPDEIKMVLQDMREHYDEQVEIYFNLQFRIGYRPSEGIDLRWSKVDWNRQELEISTAKVRGTTKGTKTEGYANGTRIVELDDDSIALLTRLKKHTFMKGDVLFTNPATGKQYYDTRELVSKYWRPSLKRCKIRDRDARQGRHTCATMMLMAGCKPAWAANQLGHSVEMFLRVYSKWIPAADKRQELSKMAAMFKDDATAVLVNAKNA